ncbi:hypothetical protein TeGR_g3625, partial [Tetraparma gracilis]
YTFPYACWHTVAVMTTLGYNYTPATGMGKFTTVLSTITGIFLETLFVVTILENLSLSHYQEVSLNYMQKRVSVEEEKHAAASFIQEVFRFIIYRNRQEKLRSSMKGLSMVDAPEKFQRTEKDHQVAQAKLLLEFRQARRFKLLKESSSGDPIMDKMTSMEKALLKELVNQNMTADKIRANLGVKYSEDEKVRKVRASIDQKRFQHDEMGDQ